MGSADLTYFLRRNRSHYESRVTVPASITLTLPPSALTTISIAPTYITQLITSTTSFSLDIFLHSIPSQMTGSIFSTPSTGVQPILPMTSSASQSAASYWSVPAGGIIGGVVSGIVAISAIAALLYYKLKALQVAEDRQLPEMVRTLRFPLTSDSTTAKEF